jgi:hypothetical protein
MENRKPHNLEVADEPLRLELVRVLRELGDRAAASAIGTSRETLHRIGAGLPVRRATLHYVRSRLTERCTALRGAS